MDPYRLTEQFNQLGIAVNCDEPMCRHTSFKTGGPADLFVCPKNDEELIRALALLRTEDVPVLVMGAGSNLLVLDGGVRGAVVSLCAMDAISVQDDVVTAEAGAKLSAVCKAGFAYGLTGMEFAGGIPGTVGGGVYMNAGAYGGELKDVLLSIAVLDVHGDVRELSATQLKLGYRHSVLMENGGVVLRACFGLRHGNVAQAQTLLAELNRRRREKQPLNFPSAGSTFKRPEGFYAGTLIEKCGLKGARVGGAMVSQKHAGFIVNTGDATSADILALIEQVRQAVAQKTGVMLSPEVRVVGEA